MTPGKSSQTISIGDTEDNITQIVARISSNTDRNVTYFCCAKVPAGKYFMITYDGAAYQMDYNFMVGM
ncbi:MAG: hypothetical protein LBI34_03225 [Puniceicoccales bacterium]|nr:hypothetical protein [Puniceicoccales bacterium]